MVNFLLKKLVVLDAIVEIDELLIYKSYRLEKLKGDLKDYYSIRVNNQWRLIFKFIDKKVTDLDLVDYH